MRTEKLGASKHLAFLWIGSGLTNLSSTGGKETLTNLGKVCFDFFLHEEPYINHFS